MKKISTMFGALLLVSLAFGQVEELTVPVPDTKMPMVSKVTASWCVYCGNPGWDTFEEMIDVVGEDGVVMGVYASQSAGWKNDRLYSDHAKELADEWTFGGYPTYFFNAAEHSGGAGSLASEITSFLADEPEVQAGFVFGLNADLTRIEAHTTVEFLSAMDGVTLNVATYLIEDKVEAPQQGHTADENTDAEHHLVLRDELSGEAFGQQIINGSAEEGESFNFTYDFEIPAEYNKDNFSIVTVIWKSEGGSWEFLNANKIPYIAYNPELPADFGELAEAPVGVADLAETSELSIYPNPANDVVTIEMNNAEAGKYLIEVYNQLGQSVKTVFNGDIASGTNHLYNVSTDDMANGMYYVKVNSGNNVKAMRLNVVH